MTRASYVIRGGQLYERHLAPIHEPARSDIGCPMLIGDSMPLTQSMADGSWHESKSGIRSTYTNGPDKFVEVGNDPARLRPREKPKPDRAAIRSSIEQAVARFDRGERA